MEEEKKHFKFGGSTIHRTELCPGSTDPIVALGDISAGPAAERGTRIHARVEALWNGEKSEALKADEEIIAEKTVFSIKQLANSLGFNEDDIKVERSFILKEISDEAGGTTDICGHVPFGDLLIGDNKFGYNTVLADDNLQLAFYAIGYLQSLDPFTRATLVNAHLVILQPEKEPPYEVKVRRWTVPVAKLEAVYGARIRAAIERQKANPDLRVPGEHCAQKYCPLQATCPAYQMWLDDKSAGAFTAALQGEVAPIGHGVELAKRAKAIPFLKAYLKNLQDALQNQCRVSPGSVPGWSLEPSLGNRSWVDEKVVEKWAKEIGLAINDFKPRVFLSPNQFTELLKAKKVTAKKADAVEITLAMDAAIGEVNTYTTRLDGAQKLVQVEETADEMAEKFLAAM